MLTLKIAQNTFVFMALPYPFSNVVLLACKRSPFTPQKGPFYNAKGVLLQGGGTTSGISKNLYPLRYVSIIAENGCKITKLSPFLQ